LKTVSEIDEDGSIEFGQIFPDKENLSPVSVFRPFIECKHTCKLIEIFDFIKFLHVEVISDWR